jgi:hypothetical protein
MFSHAIHNPNHFEILNKDKDYNVIPFGHRCTSALACKYASLRKVSLPFDWTMPTYPDKIQQVLDADFEDFIPDVYNKKFINKYNIYLAHFNENVNVGVDEYRRRIDRFKRLIRSPTKIYFVYIHEDYLYDPGYRKLHFNEDMFKKMLELETFLRTTYTNIDYNILYFNFKEHAIPETSNIINIVLHTTNLYNITVGSPYQALRRYCGKVLAEMFGTPLNFSYDDDTFNN